MLSMYPRSGHLIDQARQRGHILNQISSHILPGEKMLMKLERSLCRNPNGSNFFSHLRRMIAMTCYLIFYPKKNENITKILI